MANIIKIATRSSPLAMWQAKEVAVLLEKTGVQCEIVAVETSGDVNLTSPIYAMGITGIFTKQLDSSVLSGETDIAVHSLKDVPTQLAQNLTLAATLPRGSHEDVIILKNKDSLNKPNAVIATSSLRRRAQWLTKYPTHTTVPIRGNVQTRLRKFREDENMDGVIFAKAGLERMGLLPADAITLSWMLPASSQGIIGITCRADDEVAINICKKINDDNSFLEAEIERQFLQSLMGGCSVPIGALAKVENDNIHFHGGIFDYDGASKFMFEKNFPIHEKNIGENSAKKLMENPACSELMKKIRATDLKKEYEND